MIYTINDLQQIAVFRSVVHLLRNQSLELKNQYFY